MGIFECGLYGFCVQNNIYFFLPLFIAFKVAGTKWRNFPVYNRSMTGFLLVVFVHILILFPAYQQTNLTFYLMK